MSIYIKREEPVMINKLPIKRIEASGSASDHKITADRWGHHGSVPNTIAIWTGDRYACVMSTDEVTKFANALLEMAELARKHPR